MTPFAARASVLAVLSTLAVACGDASVVTGADATFTTELTFAQGATPWTGTYEPDEEPDVAALGAVRCGFLDLEASSVRLQYDGEDAGSFTLTATLLDGANEAPFFTWTGTVGRNQPSLRLSDATHGVSVAGGAAPALAAILARADKTFSVRYAVSAPGATQALKFQVVHVMHLRTADGDACPAP